MDENLVLIKQEVVKHLDTLVLDFDKVVMLRGWAHDDEDYYWVFETFGINSKVYWSSCVCGFITLKDSLSEKDYKRLETWFEMNRNDLMNEHLVDINRS